MTAPQVDPFAPVPITSGAGGLPGARHLEGRVVIIKPVRVDETTLGFDKKTPAPTVICDIIVVDGGPLIYGDQVNNAGQQLRPPTHRIETPAVFRGWMDSHAYIVNPLRDMLRAGQPVTVGIIERGTQGNRPYFLTETHTDVDRKPRTDPSFAQRRQLAIDVYNAFQTGQWQPPAPVELNPPAPAPSSPPMAGAWGSQPQASAQLATSFTPQPSAPAPVTFDLSRPAPGFEAMWAQLTEVQRLQLWQAQPAGTAAAAPAGPAEGWAPAQAQAAPVAANANAAPW